jgi:hypothetical protein
MEVLILLVVLGIAAKQAWDETAGHARQSRAAHMTASGSAARSRPRRAAAAVHHDTGFWAHQVSHGFPDARHGFASGWHDGGQRATAARTGRAKSRADHAETRARHVPEYRGHVQRYRDAMTELRRQRQGEDVAHATAPDDGKAAPPLPADEVRPTRRVDGKPETPADTRFFDWRQGGYRGPIDQDGNIPASDAPGMAALAALARLSAADGNGAGHHTSPDNGLAAVPGKETGKPEEGNGDMATGTAEITYTQQLDQLTQIRDECEEEVARLKRRRITAMVDALSGLGLDSATLSEAAAIDDDLRAQMQAAQQALDDAEAARDGLIKRHGGIQEAVSDSPVDQPAQPSYYAE